MRIFLHNVETYLGKILVKELRKVDGNLNRMFGTVASVPENAPKAVKRIVSREDPKRAKKMMETIQSCGLVVLDLFNSTLEDLQFAISALKVDPKSNPPKPTGDLERDVTFVLVSSVMVWAGTPMDTQDGFLKEGDYLRRTPISGSRYELWKEMEDLVMSCFNREGSMVKGLVVGGGVLYGEGEDVLCPLFKDAWRGVREHTIIAPGTNRVPTVHVRDLARLVRQVGLSGESIVAVDTPYFVAVDQPPALAEQPSWPSTQAEMVQGIVDEVCEQYDVPVVPMRQRSPADDVGAEVEPADSLQETMLLNMRIEPSALMLDPEFASQCEPPGWWCKDGLVHNIRRIADEFCRERKLQAMRVLIAGPPASGCSTLARAVSEHFRIPHLEPSPEEMADLASTLSSKVCRYRGYVLDVSCMGYPEVEKLFCTDYEVPPAEDAEGAPAEEGEGEDTPAKQIERRLNDEFSPAFVVVTQAPSALCRARWQARGTGDLEEFQRKVEQYSAANLTEGEPSLADFFQDVAKVGVLNVPVAGKDAEDIFESTRIYMEKSGRPFNYLPSVDDVASEILARRDEREEADAMKAAAEAQRHADNSAEEQRESRRHAERLQIIAAHEEEQRKLTELPLREYLMRYMVPTLTEGLIEVCKVLPENPADYLATYLEEHAAEAPNENL